MCGQALTTLVSVHAIPVPIRSLEEVLSMVEDSYDDMVETMIGMIRFLAFAPFNSGEGEGKKADYLQERLGGFGSTQRINVPDRFNLSVMRFNIPAREGGRIGPSGSWHTSIWCW